MPRKDLDVVGIGALNLDILADGAVPGFAPGTETLVDAGTIVSALDSVETWSSGLGGSAFNTVHALARTGLGLRLGYVGVAGRLPGPGVTVARRLAALGVDTTALRTVDDDVTGVCLALHTEGDRTLLTHPGANTRMAEHIAANFEALTAYLVRARFVHVTSFLDPRTPPCLARLLEAVKERDPTTTISFDPGHVWCTQRPAGVAEIMAVGDVLMVTEAELDAYGVANSGTVLVKRPGSVAFHDAEGVHTFAHEPLTAAEVVDANGAGDVFAAGVLAALSVRPARTELGVRLGMRLARHKLRHAGSGGHDGFAGIAHDVLEEGKD